MFTFDGLWQKFLAFLLSLLFGFLPALGLGCNLPTMMTRTLQDMGDLLDRPAIQASIAEYFANTDMTNPRLAMVFGTIVEFRVDGVIVRSGIKSDPNALPFDPVLLAALQDIADRHGTTVENVVEIAGDMLDAGEIGRIEPPVE